MPPGRGLRGFGLLGILEFSMPASMQLAFLLEQDRLYQFYGIFGLSFVMRFDPLIVEDCPAAPETETPAEQLGEFHFLWERSAEWE